MKLVVEAIGLGGLFAFSAFAQGEVMTTSCAEFMAMDSEGQMKAVEQMQKACDDMASDKMMPEDSMAPDDSMTPEDSMAPDDSMMAEDRVSRVLKVCEANPKMMVMDAMMEASDN